MTTLLEGLEAKARADAVYEMTLEELIAWWGSRKYSPVGQATLNYLERLQGSLLLVSEIETLRSDNAKLVAELQTTQIAWMQRCPENCPETATGTHLDALFRIVRPTGMTDEEVRRMFGVT